MTVDIGRSAFHSKTQIWRHLAKTRFFQLFWCCGLLRFCQDWSLIIFYLKKRQEKTNHADEQNSVARSTFKITGVDLATPSNCSKNYVSDHCLRILTISSDQICEEYPIKMLSGHVSSWNRMVSENLWRHFKPLILKSPNRSYFVRRRGSFFSAIFEGKKC